MFYKEPSLLTKAKLKQTAEIDKINNQKVAKKIDVYCNGVIDTIVVNQDPYGYTNEKVLTNLININKPKIDAEYNKVIKDKKTSDTLLHQVKVQKVANDKAVQISTEQYNRLQKNIEVIQKVLNEHQVNIDKYKELNKKYPATVSRKGIISESIMNKNYITGKLGKNIVPHFDGYRELTPLTESLHRQAQNEASKDLAEAQNEEAEANDEELPNTHKTWIWTGAGATTRHTSNDGQTVKIDEPFIITNDVTGEVDEMMYPLDPNVTSSNGWICYCEVEYHNRGEDAKFELTPEMIMALDSAIEALNDRMPADAYDTEINTGEAVDTSSLEVDALLSDSIPSKHSELATELIDQYSKLTNLEKLPMNATYEILSEHYKLESINNLGTLKSKFEATKKPTVNDAVDLVLKQIETWQIVEPATETSKTKEFEEAMASKKSFFEDNGGKGIMALKWGIEGVNDAFFDATYGKSFTKGEANYIENYVKDIIKTNDAYLKKLIDNKQGNITEETLSEIENAKNKLEGTLKLIKEKAENQGKAETVISETTETLNEYLDKYMEDELETLHQQALKEAEELHTKMEKQDKDAKPTDLIQETQESLGTDPLQSQIDNIIDETNKVYQKMEDGKSANVVVGYTSGLSKLFVEVVEGKTFSESGKKQLTIIKDAMHDIKNKFIENYDPKNIQIELMQGYVDTVENQYIKETSKFVEEANAVEVKQKIDYSQDEYYKEINEIETIVNKAKSEAENLAEYQDFDDLPSKFDLEEKAELFEKLTQMPNMSTAGLRKCLEMQEDMLGLLNKHPSEFNSITYKNTLNYFNAPLKFPIEEVIGEVNKNFDESVRVEIQADADVINQYIKEFEEMDYGNYFKVRHTGERMIRRINELYNNGERLTDGEIELFSTLSNRMKQAVENKIKNNNFDQDTIDALRVNKDKIPDERIIRKCKDLLNGESINWDYSYNYAQGDATVSYLKRFEPVKPSKKIIDKFNNKKPFTQNEINHLTNNIGEIRYLMELCEPAVIERGFRPVGYTKNCEALYGREPLDSKFDKYDDMIDTWVAGSDGRITECAKMIEAEGEASARRVYSERWIRYAKQCDELNKTVIPKAMLSYRGNRRTPHILDNLIGDSVGKTSYEAGMRYEISKDTCTSITEEGTRGFSGLGSTGRVNRCLVTMLHPPNSNGNYLDNKSGLSGETELIRKRGTQMQLLLFDEKTNTFLAWECYD